MHPDQIPSSFGTRPRFAAATLCLALAAGCVRETPVADAPVDLPVTVSSSGVPPANANVDTAGMVWIPGGEFIMGSDDSLARPDELPKHRVRLDGYWIDATEVTNRQFQKFVDATGYVTTAERPVDWEEIKKQLPPGTPKPPDENLLPGSMVFRPTDSAVPLDNIAQWWFWKTGASWRHPEGADSNIDDRLDHPVVQVSWDDAVAYANWAGKKLPTEAQWEYAARGGLAEQQFTWGAGPLSDTAPQANIWQGEFPFKNTEQDKFYRTAPVKSFPANGYGLYDMAGNVWEWCADFYRPDAYQQRAAVSVAVNPSGPLAAFDPGERNLDPYAPKRVQRGGSYLCNDSYCASYRPAARMSSSPDSGMSHVGFRCVALAPGPK